MEKSERERGPDLLTARNAFIVLVILTVLVLIIWLIARLNQLNQQLEALEPEYFARNQVVVQGSRNDIDTVVARVEETLQIDLVLVEFQEEEGIVPAPPPFLQQPQPPVEQEPVGRQFDPGQTQVALPSQARGTFRLYRRPHLLQDDQNEDPDQVLTELYRIVSDQEVSVANVIDEIRNQAAGTTVASDPNYTIGQPPLIIEGDPESTEGGAVLPGEPGAALAAFYNQWALDERGVGLFNTEATETDANGVTQRPDPVPSVTFTGQDVTVALFDTSPFDLQRLPVEFANTNVQHFEVVGIPDARDHGVFGASLVNVIAPDSGIRIYRVLNERNQGDLVTLLRALNALRDEWEGTPGRPLVINLSLGIHLPPDEGDGASEQATSGDVPTLAAVLQELHSLGAVIVAASGNDSAERFRNNDGPADMQIPARYDFVLGVGASNFNGQYSCFSNGADVYAPGGDNDEQCMPIVNQCGDQADHAACIIGYSVYISPGTHYAYWLGTSFAAPLVSGQAALLLEAGVPPERVQQRIIDTATKMLNSDGTQSTGGGIINIPASMP